MSSLRIGAMVAGLCVIAIQPGCTVLSNQDGIPFEWDEGSFVDRTTTLGDALREIGPPSQVTALEGGVGLLYETLGVNELQIGIASPGIDILKIAGGMAGTHRQILLLMFDGEGILVAHRYLEFEKDLGLGGGLQTVFSVKGLVDASSLDDPFDSHDWGTALLDPLPRTLNRAQSLDSGEEGFQLRGTPSRVGQHTLETP